MPQNIVISGLAYHYFASEIFCEFNIYVCKMRAFSEDKCLNWKYDRELIQLVAAVKAALWDSMYFQQFLELDKVSRRLARRVPIKTGSCPRYSSHRSKSNLMHIDALPSWQVPRRPWRVIENVKKGRKKIERTPTKRENSRPSDHKLPKDTGDIAPNSVDNSRNGGFSPGLFLDNFNLREFVSRQPKYRRAFDIFQSRAFARNETFRGRGCRRRRE